MTSKTILRTAALTVLGAGAICSVEARPIPANLGNGLDALVESNLASKSGARALAFDGYATEAAANYARLAIMDPATGKPMIRIHLNGTTPFEPTLKALTRKFSSLKVTAVEANYRGGVIEGYLHLDDVPEVAKTTGVGSVVLSLKPYNRATLAAAKAAEATTSGAGSDSARAVAQAAGKSVAAAPAPVPAPQAITALTRIGNVFDQGVTQHRVDRINQIYNPSAPINLTGNGISIGVISDSYDTRTGSGVTRASVAVNSFDLPGSASNTINSQPVVVLQDFPGGTDEGRGMMEIVYKMAPKARLAFATANNGEVGFANNIRALAGLPGYTYPAATQQGFRANVICDDVGYYDEPYFSDGLIGIAIDDVSAYGVTYFSSAANNIPINGYDSDLRIVPNGSGLTSATNSALVGTNINLTGVPTNLYQGGFHNFNPNGLDVALLTNIPASNTTPLILQWDDPYDQAVPAIVEPPIFSGSGNVTSATPVSFTGIPFTAGQQYVITEAHTAASPNMDAIVSVVRESDSAVILTQDTGADETVVFFPPTTGNYTIRVARFSTTTGGNFTIKVNLGSGSSTLTTDLNLLVFNASTGAYISATSLTTNNYATNQPIELGVVTRPTGQTQVQFVIARASVPTAPKSATHVRWVMPGNGAGGLGPAEYANYLAPTTGGHAIAKTCNGTAAYSAFRPSIPESFTSPGPGTSYFDRNNNRLETPEVRLQPSIAAADNANTSWFPPGNDVTRDLDTNNNFPGTSAAAPHAAGVAALVLEAHGGPLSVTPGQMTDVLRRSAFPHDLDPYYASGTARTAAGGKVFISINSDADSNTSTGQNDANAFTITYNGPSAITSFTFNPTGTAATAGNTTGGNNGIDASTNYFANSFPGMVFLPATRTFLLGTLTGLVPADITQPVHTPAVVGYSNLAPAPSGANQFWTMSIGFAAGKFTSGRALRFTVGRGEQHTSITGNGASVGPGTTAANAIADLFGGGVTIPEGVVNDSGMTFSGTLEDGSTFNGVIRNRLGAGYSVLDGFGFINAESAVSLPLTPGL